MRAIRITGAALVLVLTGLAVPAYAQQGHQGDSRDRSAQQRSDQQRPQRRQTRAQRAQEQQRVRRDTWQQHRARSWDSDHRTWQDRGGYQGYRVPDNRFRRYFGPQHSFRMNRLPFRVTEGRPSFRYRGYWLNVVDPWPERWSDNWYDNDDVYVNYVDDGYYLFNRREPRFRIALRISL